MYINNKYYLKYQPAEYINVTNRGLYVAFFNLTFYDKGHRYDYTSPNLLTGKCYKILFASTAKQFTLNIFGYTGIKSYKLICRKTYDDSEAIDITLIGTILNPQCIE